MTLGEVKGLAKVSETVAHRAGRINPDIKKSVAALDAKYPGSTVSAELMKYGKDGEYLALVTGSLGNCSADVLVIVDFIAGIKTVRALELRTTNIDQLFSTYRRSLLSSFGLFTTRLWARHIHDRSRDASFSLPNSLTLIGTSPGISTPMRAARSTAAPAAALKRARLVALPLL